MRNEAVLLIFLFGNTMTDLKERRIRLWFAAVFTAIGLSESLMDCREIESVMMSLLPGILIICCAMISRGEIGFGDGIVLSVMGLLIDEVNVWEICAVSLFLSFIGAMILYALKKDGKITVPFIPYLMAGSVSVLMVWRII